MALIYCPNCGKQISDKAEKCVQCGYSIQDNMQQINNVCPECHATLSGEEGFCPNCGHPLSFSGNNTANYVQPSFSFSVDDESYEERRRAKKRKLIISLGSILLCVGLGLFIWYQNYVSTFRDCALMIIDSISETEEVAGKIHDVWYNTLFEIEDVSTDQYTKDGDYFYEDFNDSLDVLWSERAFSLQINNLSTDKDDISELVSKLKTAPPNYREAYAILKAIYLDYSKMVNLVTNPEGENISSFTDSFNTLDDSIVENYEELILYLD